MSKHSALRRRLVRGAIVLGCAIALGGCVYYPSGYYGYGYGPAYYGPPVVVGGWYGGGGGYYHGWR